MKIMERLSNEILAAIFSHLSKGGQRDICLVSTRFCAVATPILYHSVDFRARHFGQDAERCGCTEEWHIVEHRQVLWTGQIIQNPHLGLLVRSFSWTLLDWYNEGKTWRQNFKRGPFAIYDMLRLISAATRCCIEAGPSQTHRAVDPPQGLCDLFPRARDISLQGDIHPVLALAILHGKGKSLLTNLTLENVIEPVFREHHTLKKIMTKELQLRCRGLKTLKVRKEGLLMNHPPSLFDEIDLDEYKDLAHIIQSLVPEFLIFAHGKQAIANSGHYNYYIVNYALKVGDYPKDRRFHEVIVPVLLKGWPTLRAIDIRGVSKEITACLSCLHVPITTSEVWELE